MSTVKKHRPDTDEHMVANERDLRTLAFPSLAGEREESPTQPRWERGLLKVGAMAQTTQYKPFWNPAFVGAAGLILTLLLVTGGFIWNYATLSANNQALQKQVDKYDEKMDKLRIELQEQKDYTRDAIDALARELNVPSPKPKKGK